MYYHASQIGDIKVLEPRISNDNVPLIYFSTKRENVLVYLSNAVEKFCKENGFLHDEKWHKWATYGFDSDGTLILDEYYPNAIEDTYKCVSGYIYCVDDIVKTQENINISNAVTTSEPVPVSSVEFIEDAYSEILKATEAGLIKIRRYEDLNDKMLSWIEKTIKNEYKEAENEPDYRYFLKAKFSFLNSDFSHQGCGFMDATKKFDGIANEYTKSRPGYASEFIESLYEKYGFNEYSVIADVGSGTGKFAKQLLDKGSKVFCVEPNADMRLVAESELNEYSNFSSVNGSAENTTLDDNSVDFITTAQAFHWFDTKSFKKESSRIIKTGGKVFLIWNTRKEDTPVMQKLHGVYSKCCPNFKGFCGGMKLHDDRIKEFFNHEYEYVTFDNHLYFDREKFINCSLSASYSLKKGDNGFDLYIEEINKVFDEFEIDGIVKIENQTVAYVGTLEKGG